MTANKIFGATGWLIYTLVANISWADDVAPNKKILRPIGVQGAASPAAQATVTGVKEGADVSLNPQPFPPAESAKFPANTLKPASALPLPAENRDGNIQKPGLPPLAPIGGINQPSGIGAQVGPIGNDVKLNDGLKGATLDACMGKPCIISVNGRNVGNNTFKPGTRYQIVGKKFGNTRGDVVLNIDGDVAVKLDVTAWHDEEIIAYFKNDFGGKPNSNDAALFIDVPNTPRILPANSQHGRFEALIVKQTIPFSKIPQSAIIYEKGEQFGGPELSDNGYSFKVFFSGNTSQNVLDSVKRQYTDMIDLGFIKQNFKVTDVHADFTRTDTNGSRCDRCGAGSGGTYVYGDNGWELKSGKLVIKRAVWQNHISPTLTKAGSNQFFSWVEPLELVVEGPKGVNPIK